MSTLEKWLEDHSATYAQAYGELAIRAIDELKAVEARVRALDPLGALRVIGAHDGCRLTAQRDGGAPQSVRHELPVVEVSLPKRGLRVCASDDFLYGWAITVEAERPLAGLDVSRMDFHNLTASWFGGFAEAKAPIHGPYRRDQRRFSFHFRVLDGLSVAIDRLVAASA